MSYAFSETCDLLLRRPWDDLLSKRRYTIHDISFFVSWSIKCSIDPLGRITSLLHTAIKDFMEELNEQPKKENGTDTYPTLKYTTFNLYYTPMFQYLVEIWDKDFSSREIAKTLVAKVG